MCLEYENQEQGTEWRRDVSRRTFGAMAAVSGAVAATGSASAAALDVMEMDVTIKTADGNCDALLVHPKTGTHPAVLIWVDALGLRPSFRDMAKRLAAEGYVVLVPNPFYRAAKAPVFPPNFSFQNPDDRAKIMQFMGALTPELTEKDAAAFVAFLDKQSVVKKGSKIGTQGYCMGGSMTMRTAANHADRIGAGASFHGGGLVQAKPESPHLLAPKIKAKYVFAVAADDDQREPDSKNVLKKAFDDAKNPADVSVFAGGHGWCVPDMPAYNKDEAERAWSKLLSLYKTALV